MWIWRCADRRPIYCRGCCDGSRRSAVVAPNSNVIEIDTEETAATSHVDLALRGPAADLLPRLL